MHTAYKAYTPAPSNGIILVGTPKGIVPYSAEDESDWAAAEAAAASPFVPLVHDDKTYQPATVEAVAAHLMQQDRSSAQKLRKKQAHWFIDDRGTRRYGVAIEANCDEPMFMFEEHMYCRRTKTLYEELTPPRPKPSMLDNIDEDPKSLSTSFASAGSSFARPQVSPSSDNATALANNSFRSQRSSLLASLTPYSLASLPKN